MKKQVECTHGQGVHSNAKLPYWDVRLHFAVKILDRDSDSYSL